MKKNELLDADIKKRIDDARYEETENEKEKRSPFYITVVVLVTVSVLVSLLRYLM